MTATAVVSVAFLALGAFFFLAGTIGLLRFPDVYARLHALGKADNLGLGFVTAGLVLQADGVAQALKLGIVWALVIVSSSMCCQLIARSARSAGVEPWRRPE